MDLPAPLYPAKMVKPDADDAEVASRIAQRMAQLPRPLVLTNGVFDVLHRGHVTYLEQARQLGAALVVAVNSDASVRRLNKGSDRPLNTLEDRMAVLAALACVDLVVPFDDDTPRSLIVQTMPDVLVKGGDYSADTTAGAAEVIAHGGRFVAVPFQFQRSTTALVERIRANASSDNVSAFEMRAFEMPVDRELDACGLKCPLPILRAKRALNEMASGQKLRILATDSGSVGDFQSFAKQSGNALLAQSEKENSVFGFVLQRK